MRAFRNPVLAAVGMSALHVAFGARAGFLAYVTSEAIYDTMTGRVLAAIYGVSPGVSVFLCTFVLGTIVQEFWRGTRVRMKNAGEGPFTALFELVTRAKRRYGGYIVHASLVLMYLGFTGAAYDVEKEASLRQGQRLTVGSYELRYDRPRMEVDPNKRMIFTDLTVFSGGKPVGTVSPAKFIYRTHPDMPTTEVAIRSTLLDDVYVIMSKVNPETKVGIFRVIVRPLVAWIWIGSLLLLFGSFVAISPSIKELLEGVRDPVSATNAGVRPALASWFLWLLVLTIALGGATAAFAQDSSSLMAGNVEMHSAEERQLFERVLCQCGGCARLPLSNCICHWAEEKRTELRSALADGKTVTEIQDAYAEQYGVKAIAIPRDKGLDRALWAVPIAAFVAAAGGIAFLGRKWVKRNQEAQASGSVAPAAANVGDDLLDRELDAELKRFDDK
jgi:cytochrome c-type biogenesis protein CcmF